MTTDATNERRLRLAIEANKRFALAARRFGDEAHAQRIDRNTVSMERRYAKLYGQVPA